MAVVVRRKPTDTDDKVISEFRRLILKYKIIDEIKDRLFYLKPSARRNIARNTKKKKYTGPVRRAYDKSE